MNIRSVAHLARIALSEEEAERYQEQVDQILKYIEQLNEIDVEGIEPTAHAGAVFNIVREDVALGTSLSQEAALSNAPAVAHNQFRMPKVVE
ncbi:MAG: Asp-tRNA(Asn)/Glu-tRNA(Gln) amidotransferase subunit GatC [Verrucomicrobiales bacterium]|jgi:aspartyl-tRNA(Asn)/glutamyl-tRNA(Gln) amidotransferase subunit C|nr:Asp-tRNA(Asn)/Glu-tRNA(Gln) amidotransferase subunit GatC [Verrucomicrobiales bacterium]MBP9223511.1 Asp-tRNA(Asn)/Glu-tRNA(Gln) amidotransferase subunit GatC [Verrucomicrobiales bacterium]HQZ27493.1 Asp-tRNA(Asn)/Glu-tRNA(Gln) amidotransferase subunit GatC [Verrucomicrobiales bacterium]